MRLSPKGQRVAAALGLGLLASPALAAPYCIKNQVLPAQCLYYDPAQCQREAQRQNAECSANPAEVTLSAGNGKYCLISPGGVSTCYYTDLNSCNREAARQHGACVESSTDQPFQAPNPYSPVNGD